MVSIFMTSPITTGRQSNRIWSQLCTQTENRSKSKSKTLAR